MTVIKLLPELTDPLDGVKGQIFKFRNNSVSCQYFLLKFLHADRGKINIKHINAFLNRSPVSDPWGVMSKDQKSTFSEQGHGAYHFK